jgi:superfamily II DNA or RNA helicase
VTAPVTGQQAMIAGRPAGGTAVLWPHQRAAVAAAAAHLAVRPRCLVVMACGTGKTLVGAEVSRLVAAGGKVLVVVPTLELLAQTARVYAQRLGLGAGLIGAACSEITATRDIIEVRAGLAGTNASVSTAPGDIAAWFCVPGRVTVFTTYQSLGPVSAACARPGVPVLDLVVIDEAHRAAGRTDRAWHLVNDDAAIPAARRLYMTATPRLMSSDRYETASMDDEKIFGPQAYHLPFAEAIGNGLLADYRVAVVMVTDAETARLVTDGRMVSAGGPAVPAGMLAAQVALLKAAAQWDLRRIITYHSRVAGARRFAETLLNAADLLPGSERPRLIRAGSVDGSMRLQPRREVLRHLEDPGGRTVIVSNSRVLSEGIDIPELDAVMFADPRDSGTDVIQAVGRALRRGSQESKIATIIIPIVLADGETPETALQGSRFEGVWRVVRALRAHDERLADWLDEQRIRGTRREAGNDSGTGDTPDWLTVLGTPARPSFAAALRVRMIGAATSRWLDGYAHAAAWHDQHRHLRIPHPYVAPDGYTLGWWIAGQRQNRKTGSLTRDQITRLDALEMDWEPSDSAWQDTLRRLAAWKNAHGHLAIPRSYRDADGFPLGQSAANLRQRHPAARQQQDAHARPPLSRDKVAALDALGFPWHTGDYRWSQGLAAAQDYHAGHGHLEVPQSHVTPGGFRLGTWTGTQRRRRVKGTLNADQIAALDALGMRWGSETGWSQGLEAVRKFHAAYGHINIPQGHPLIRGMDAAAWIADKRSRHRHGNLPGRQAAILEDLGITWSPADEAWNSELRALEDFTREHGHPDVPRGYRTPTGSDLYKWLGTQRRKHSAGALAPQRAAALEALGVPWESARDRSRNAMIAALRDFAAQHGHANVPYRHVTASGLPLGTWLKTVRHAITTGRHHPHPGIMTALRDCGLPWTPPETADTGTALPSGQHDRPHSATRRPQKPAGKPQPHTGPARRRRPGHRPRA